MVARESRCDQVLDPQARANNLGFLASVEAWREGIGGGGVGGNKLSYRYNIKRVSIIIDDIIPLNAISKLVKPYIII